MKVCKKVNNSKRGCKNLNIIYLQVTLFDKKKRKERLNTPLIILQKEIIYLYLLLPSPDCPELVEGLGMRS